MASCTVSTPGTLFLEVFAGEGGLSSAVSRLGVPTLPPQDFETGGADLGAEGSFLDLLSFWRAVFEGARATPVFHFATPCASFSVARDRNPRTRLRSRTHPWGLYPDDPVTRQGNLMATRTAQAVRALLELNGTGTIENPVGSYLCGLSWIGFCKVSLPGTSSLPSAFTAPPTRSQPVSGYLATWTSPLWGRSVRPAPEGTLAVAPCTPLWDSVLLPRTLRPLTRAFSVVAGLWP